MRPAILLLVCLIAGCVYDPYGRTLRDQCMLAALSSSAVNSTGITRGMAAGGIGIRGRITDIGTGTLTGHRVDRQAVDQPTWPQ